MTKIINISENYSQTPGARHRSDGDFSGQEFFEDILEDAFNNISKGGNLLIDLDGTDGYATSFLDEAFGGLARKYTKAVVLSKLKFKSDEEPYLIDEIISYM